MLLPGAYQTRDAVGQWFTYDAENRQITSNTGGVSNSYDGDGRRVKKLASGVTTVFVYNVLGQMIAEYNNSTQTPATGTSYVATDTLGSTRAVINGLGNVISRHDYFPFGESIFAGISGRTTAMGYGSSDLLGPRQKLTGKERDAESGLDYFGARYSSGVQGRFASPDPFNIFVEANDSDDFNAFLSDPQNWNSYSYVANNPQSYIDPDGRNRSIAWLSNPATQRAIERGVSRVATATANYGRVAYGWAAQFFNSPTGQDLTQTAIEAVSGVPLGMSISPRSALAREINVALGAANAGTQLEGQVAKALFNDVVSFRREIVSAGKRVGEIDVELKNVIIDTTVASKAKAGQIARYVNDASLNPGGKAVIVFGPNLTRGAAQAIQRTGARVARSLDELKKILKDLEQQR